MKINLDKYYTNTDLAKYCIEKTKEIIGEDNITEYLEPSAGNGAFSLQIPKCIAYDIEPEHESIIKQNYLELDTPYKKGRLIIGNPPFGERNNLSRYFYNKSVELGDYISFILPVSQFNNVDSLYKFDLIHSEVLPTIEYSGIKINCCLNIYKRPKNGLNKKLKINTNLFELYRDDQYGYDEIEYDICIYRGGASAGKEKFTNINKQTYKIKVKDNKDLEYVKNTILNFNWKGYKKHQSAPSISKNDIYRLFIK